MAQRVVRGIALRFHDRGTRRGWVVSSAPRPHFTPGKDPVPILQEAGCAPAPVWTGGKSRPHRDSIPDRPARSQSLYRLSCPAHFKTRTPPKSVINRPKYQLRYQVDWTLQSWEAGRGHTAFRGILPLPARNITEKDETFNQDDWRLGRDNPGASRIEANRVTARQNLLNSDKAGRNKQRWVYRVLMVLRRFTGTSKIFTALVTSRVNMVSIHHITWNSTYKNFSPHNLQFKPHVIPYYFHSWGDGWGTGFDIQGLRFV